VRRWQVAVALALALGLASCGGGDSAEPAGPTVTQHVTRDFGREVLSAQDDVPLRGHGTAMRLLTDYHDVKKIWGGLLVESIDGLAQDAEGGTTSWALNVNGIEADEYPAHYRLYPGDVVQWDRRDYYVTLDVRATVGAFPETFTRGVFGKRFPVRVLCERPASSACRRVRGALRDAGVRTDGSPPAGEIPRRGLPRRSRILVGTWHRLRNARWAPRVDAGPRYSGVFARFSPDDRELRLLDWDAHRVRTEGAGTGLVAAMRPTEEDLLWLITGVDQLGVERAAAALQRDSVRDAFAVAVTEEGVEKLPLPPD
jgi:Domain of unknown function (DUF4430)